MYVVKAIETTCLYLLYEKSTFYLKEKDHILIISFI